MLNNSNKLASSFRDPAGFLFEHQGILFRQVNEKYHADYDHLIQSGLYQTLIQKQMLIPHQEVGSAFALAENAIIIQPERIPFISYPYEWCFSQLKDAALLTLNIQKIALKHGMTLKDASCYNIQFHHGKPILIDTLSFAKYQENLPWIAYKQFCQHFLAPLMLMSKKDVRLNQLLKIYIDGIPLDLASALLPTSSKFKLASFLHIHLHVKMQNKHKHTQDINLNLKSKKFPLATLNNFIDSLIHAVDKLEWKIKEDSEWFDYYEANNNYSEKALFVKEKIIDSWLQDINPASVWDLGANTGRFSTIASKYSPHVVAWDIDVSCVEKFYLHTRKIESPILALNLDLTNPSPAIGWAHHERSSFMDRGPVDTILALGLIHHLVIVNNVPLERVAQFFSKLCTHLIIEFIPKEDSQVEKLLSTREDIFEAYDQKHFEEQMQNAFNLQESIPVEGTKRTLYLFRKID